MGSTKQKSLGNAKHPKAVENLKTKLSAELATCVVDRGTVKWDTEPWGWEFAKSASRQCEPHLTIGNVWRFLTSSVERALPVDASGPLTGLLGPEELQKLVGSVTDWLGSFPREYEFLTHIGNIDTEPINITLGPDTELRTVEANDALSVAIAENRRPSVAEEILAKMAGRSPLRVFSDGQIVLAVKSRGFSLADLEDSAPLAALSSLKRTLYLGELLGVFRREEFAKFGPRRARLYSRDVLTQAVFEMTVPEELSLFVGQYSYVNSESAMTVLLAAALANADDKDFAPIGAALEWAFDGRANKNQTVSLLMMCIGIEAILGDEQPRPDVTTTLSNRCAYLLADTPSQRQLVRKKFEDLYNRRSRLVHGRQNRLDEADLSSMWWGQGTLDKIIRVEFMNYARALTQLLKS